MKKRTKIDITSIDRFKPKLYADLYVPSWVNGYSIAMEYVHNWFLSKFPKDFFKTVHVVGKTPFDDFRRFEYGDYVKRQKPAVSFAASINYDNEFSNIDLHMFGIDTYMMKTDFHRSFFKDPMKKLYLGHVAEAMEINFTIRTRFSTRAEQLDMYKKMELLFRIGCTTTVDTDLDFHVPYDLMSDLARDAGFQIDVNGTIMLPYEFLFYLNQHSQIPFLYKLRYINGKHEFFIRMNNMPLYLDTRNKLDPDDGEQEGQTMNNFNIDFPVRVIIPVPQFYIYYSEGKLVNELHLQPSHGTNVYSMRVLDIPDVNEKGWTMYGTSNYLKEKDEKYVKEIDISSLFVAPVDTRVDISLEDLIEDSIQCGISPSTFIDIRVYTNDMMAARGKLPSSMDWKRRKIILPDDVKNSYFYLIIYTEQGYINSKVIDINKVYKNRITDSKRTKYSESGHYKHEPTLPEPEEKI